MKRFGLLVALAWGVVASARTEVSAPPFAFFPEMIPASAERSVPSTGLYSNEAGSPLLPLVQAARRSIDIEIYTMNDVQLRTALRDALARGVRIRIVKEGSQVDADCKVFDNGGRPNAAVSADCADQRRFVQEVNSSPGGAYVPFNKSAFCPPGTRNCLEHGKMVIADGASVLLSTGNFDATNLCDKAQNPRRCNRDFSYILDDSNEVAALSAVFEKDLAGRSYDLAGLLNSFSVPALTVSPIASDAVLALIRGARQSIQIQNQYLKEPKLNAALVDAANRGVRVQVMTASACAFGKPSNSDKNKVSQIYSAFDRAGIESKMFSEQRQVGGKPGYLHAKAILIDGDHGWVGSINGSTQAFFANREFGRFFDDAASVRVLAQTFDSDFASNGMESWQDSLDCALDFEKR